MHFLFVILTILLKFLYVLAYPFFWWQTRKVNRHKVPELTKPLLKISATELAKKIRSKQISSQQICNLYIQRIKEVNPIINAVVQDRFESALEEAKQVDAFLQTFAGSYADLEQKQPLLGVPLTVKESCSVAGSSLCGGTLSRVGIRAETDGESIGKLRAAGAIPLLVSNIPEVCLAWESSNFITGRTNNPYDTTRTSAGSSGGEGALLASGASLIGVGSDVAGSIRLPAMFNGVFGHKPSAKTIPIAGHFPYSIDENYADVFVVGPMVRYAEDLKLMMNVMADKRILPSLRLDEKVDISKVRVYHMTRESNSIFSARVSNEIKNAIKESVNFLKTKCNAQIIENSKFHLLAQSNEIAGSVLCNLKAEPNLLKEQSLALEIGKCLIGQSNHTFNLLVFYFIQVMYEKLIINKNYLQKNNQLRQLFIDTLGTDGVFLYPVFPTVAFPHNASILEILSVSYLMIFNTLGLPATSVPCGVNKHGLPYGIQVVAGPNQDRLCFAVAEELEKLFGGWKSP